MVKLLGLVVTIAGLVGQFQGFNPKVCLIITAVGGALIQNG